MLILQAVILGLVQGLSEFIPVSSSAHLIIVPWLFGWNDPVLDSLSFDVALHLGTLLALLVFFAADWGRLIRAGVSSIVERRIGGDIDRRLAWLIVVGTIPGGIAGIVGEAAIEQLFHKPNVPIAQAAMIVMAVIIALLGAILFIAERIARHIRRIEDLTLKDSIVIGLAQAFAIFPGVSRSGSTISAGLFIGLERATAARFSFLLSAPIIAGAGAKSLFNIYNALKAGQLSQGELALFPIGFFAAALSGYLCIKFLLQYLQKNSTDLFVFYRWGLAVVVLAFAVLRG